MNPARPERLLRFRLDDLPPEPWRNGGGLTRTIAADGICSGAPWRWRISAADIAQDGPFSRFEHVDRSAVLIGGRGLSLRGKAGSMTFDAIGDAHRFAGELDWHAHLHAGPARLWNVMTRRSAARAETRPLRSDQSIGGAATDIVLVLAGAFRVDDASVPPFDLLAGEGLVLQEHTPALRLVAGGADAAGLHTSVLIGEARHEADAAGPGSGRELTP